MAPTTRHGSADAGASENHNNSSSTYGTRSSKRKAAEYAEDEQLSDGSPAKKIAVAPSRKSEATSPVNKRKTPARLAQPKSSQSNSQEGPSSSSSSTPVRIPAIAVEAPNETSEEPSSASSPKPAWIEPPDLPVPLPSSVPSSPGGDSQVRGGSIRGGRGGRGGKLGKGSRGGKAAPGAKGGSSGRATPAVAINGVVKTGRGGGRGRVKKFPSARLAAVQMRKDELKGAFKVIAQLQRVALGIVAERSAEKAKEDPNYHKSQPEYQEVIEGLRRHLDQRHEELRCRQRLDEDLAQRQFKYSQDQENMIYKTTVELVGEIYEAKVKERAVYLYHQALRHQAVDEISFSKGENERHVKVVPAPEKIVHPLAAALFKIPLQPYSPLKHKDSDLFEQDPKYHSTVGDNALEQHPANFWQSLSEKGKKDFRKHEAQAIQELKEGKKNKKTKTKESLFSTAPVPVIDDAVDDNEEPEPEEIPTTTKSNTTDGDDPYENAKEQPEDENGFIVPARRARGRQLPPNNRIQGPSYIQYNPLEIGQRIHHVKSTNGDTVEIGMDSFPTPKNLYYNQVASHHNAAKNKPGDLDEKMVEQHVLHPIMGLPMHGSINPDYEECEEPYFEPSDIHSRRLPEQRPYQMIIEKSRDGDRDVFYTSRSGWIQQIEDDFKIVLRQIAMKDALKEAGEFEIYRQEKQVIDAALLDAAEDKRLELEREEAIPKAPPAVISPPVILPAPMPVAPQRPQQYDPVRESAGSSGYDSPYSRPPPPRAGPSRPSGHPPGRISELADLALSDASAGHNPRSMFMHHPPPPPPPPQPYERGIPFSQPSLPGPSSMHVPLPPPPMPPMIHSSPQQQHYQIGAGFYHSHPVASPYQQQPQRPGPLPHQGLPGSGFRQLRPAPPQNRPLPPSPNRGNQWHPYGGHQ